MTFWKKKDEKVDKSAPPPDASAGTFEPAQQPEKADPNLFGGLAVVKRKKKGAVEDLPPAPAPAPATVAPAATPAPVETAPPPAAPAPPAPFFAKFELPAGGNKFEEEDDDSSRVRKRLERFYEEYNPSKLSQLDQTLKQYVGREEELFSALVQKYGKEPDQTPVKPAAALVAAKPSGSPLKSRKAEVLDAKPEAAATNATSAFGFTAATDGAAGQSNWGFDNSAAASAGSGFGFADSAAGGFATTSAGGGFGFATEAEQGQGFAFGSAAAGETTGFGFATESPAQATGFGFTDAPAPTEFKKIIEEPDQQAANDKSSLSDDDDEPTMNERHASALRNSQGDVLIARQDLAAAIKSSATVITNHHSSIDSYTSIEARIEDCIAKEDFTLAEELTSELETIAKDIAAFVILEREVSKTIEPLTKKLQGEIRLLSELYAGQRLELLKTRGAEEVSANKYISENSSRLELAAEKVRAALERATRALNNSSQEVVNLEQRHQKIIDKISEQTKGLRTQRDEVASAKDLLEAEISELEAKLASKRRALATTKVELSSIDEKLHVIAVDHSETIGEVERQLAEERSKKSKLQSDVDVLSSQQESVLEEDHALKEETERLRSQLTLNNHKIESYAVFAKTLNVTTPNEVDEYIRTTVVALVNNRRQGALILAAAPESMDSSAISADANGSPLSDLATAKSHLAAAERAVQADKAVEATAALRLQEIAKSVPLLETAKKNFAAAKQFKEAQAKSEELKKLQEEQTIVTSQIAQSQARIVDGETNVTKLNKIVEKESTSANKKIQTFMVEYGSTLNSVQSKCTTAPNVLQLDEESLACQPDELQLAIGELVAVVIHEYTAAIKKCNISDVPEVSVSAAPVKRESVSPPHAEVVEEAPAEPPRSAESIQEELDELTQKMADAINEEEYQLCEELQEKIDQLNVLLAACT